MKTKTKKATAPPVPTRIDSRICFGIAYFTNEPDALAYEAFVRERGDQYNGGWFHGMSCGRDKTWDYFDKALGKQLYAVTEA